MAASKLYPTLSTFYRNNYIGFGSEGEHLPSGAGTDNRLARRNSLEDKTDTSNLVENNRLDKDGKIYDKAINIDVAPIYPSLSIDVGGSTDSIDEIYNSGNSPRIPSAPPIDLLDDDFINFIQNLIAERTSPEKRDDNAPGTPVVDYSTLNLPSDFVLDETWVDDLLPDYDLSSDEMAADFLNNLNVELSKEAKLHKEKEKPLAIRSSSNRPRDHSPVKMTPGTSATHVKDYQKYQKLQQQQQPHHHQHQHHHHQHRHHHHHRHQQAGQDQTRQQSSRTKDKNGNEEPVVVRHGHRHRHAHGQTHKTEAVQQEKENKPVRPANVRPDKPVSPGSPEYEAWMTWRKQVNRQLATVILLRRGAQIRVERDDVSRQALNQRSIDFVSQMAKNGSKTSLGGKPYVMYGIPRASLSNVMY